MKNPFETTMNIFRAIFTEGLEKFGRYYSKYRGFVSDNEDPEGFGRLKLVIPQITGKFPLEYWAWPANNFSGDGYGMQIIPSKGDMVWVEFEMGNTRVPIWNFGHFSFKADGKTPEKPKALKDVKNYWFKTPKGNLIEFDDTNKWVLLTPVEKFLIGAKDADEPAVLGNQLKTILNEILDLIKDQATASAAATYANSAGATGVATNVTSFTQVSTKTATTKQKVSKTLSKIMFLKE